MNPSQPTGSPIAADNSSRPGRDRIILYTTALLRAAATGMSGVLMGVYLARLQFSPTVIGVMVAAGLAGGALAALLATLVADQVGRRAFLFAIAVLGAIGGFVVAAASTATVIMFAAFFGMVNGMGKDRGASLVVEQALLPSTTTHRNRTRVFAVYNVIQAAGAAVGALLAAAPPLIHRMGGIPELIAMRFSMAAYGALMLATAMLYPALTATVDLTGPSGLGFGIGHVSSESRTIVTRLSALFAIDSLGGGFLTQALIAYFFVVRFNVGAGAVGPLFFGAHLANAASQFAAAFLARRIGLVNTMVFTHIPGSLLLIAVAFAPNFPLAAALYLMRECLIQMDVPTRQSYVMAIVRPEERTFAAGVTSLVRLGGWAVAPSFAGFFMQGVSLATPLVIGSLMKVGYDLLLYRACRGLKPPEEIAAVDRPQHSNSSYT